MILIWDFQMLVKLLKTPQLQLLQLPKTHFLGIFQ
jgi:hypothetical protein